MYTQLNRVAYVRFQCRNALMCTVRSEIKEMKLFSCRKGEFDAIYAKNEINLNFRTFCESLFYTSTYGLYVAWRRVVPRCCWCMRPKTLRIVEIWALFEESRGLLNVQCLAVLSRDGKYYRQNEFKSLLKCYTEQARQRLRK